jgi:acetoin utilization deacetylase AcuC-like enzyme
MITIFSDDHRKHFPQAELSGGQFVTPFERPSRVEFIMAEMKQRKMLDLKPPGKLDMKPVRKVHDADYLDFLASAWADWQKAGYRGEIMATVLPVPGMRKKLPKWIDGKVGYFCHSIETAITSGTWEAAQSSAAVAQTAQRLVQSGQSVAFALCRPPGHHAHRNLYGGYCFLNNAAIAAQGFLDSGAKRVAILDVDVHHGNGTQDIFYRRKDVLFCSLHGDPLELYPHFLGYADEKGEGQGEGLNINYPMKRGTAYDAWSKALRDALKRIKAFKADVLVVSLGVDAFKLDPVGLLGLNSPDFIRCGAEIAKAKLPTLFVMEGGYAIQQVGVNTANVLQGFLDA